MKKIVCYCEHSFEADVPETADLDKNGADLENILKGEFFIIKCPKCGTELRPEFPLKVTSESQNIDIFLIPELDRAAYFMNKLEYNTGDPARIVIGFRELVDKLTVMKAGLDDRVMEAVKFYILSRAQENESVDEIKIYFHDKNDVNLIFFIEGLKKDEIAKYEMNLDFYSKIEASIDKKVEEEPFSELLKPPYVSINKIYME